MLYFSKAKLIIIYLIISFLFLSFFTNFINNKDQLFLSKKINLGLDLQGGSYLLLEVDSQPLIKQNLQIKLINLRKLLKEQKIKYQNLKLDGQSIKFKISDENLKIFEELFLNKDNLINTFYNKYNSYEMNYSIKDNFVLINYSKYGIIEVKTSSFNQS